MAEGKNIEIRIAATGGDQAAAEVKKVEAATEQEAVSIRKLEQELDRANKAYKSAALGSAEFTAASKRLAAAQESLAVAKLETTPLEVTSRSHAAQAAKITASNASMRNSFQNVGYQIQDFAVQTSMGTSAMRAFGQQAPQLLSAFGPWGVGIGTVVALGAPLIGTLLGSSEAADEAAESYRDATLETIEMAKADEAATALTKSRAEALAAFEQQLLSATGSQSSYNDALRAELEILKEKAAAENAVADAKGQTELEGAEGDPVRQEQIRNRLRREAQARELNQTQTGITTRRDLINRLFQEQQTTGTNAANLKDDLLARSSAAGDAALQAEQDAALLKGRGKDSAAADKTREAEALRAQQKDLADQAAETEKAAVSAAAALDREMQKIYQELRKLENDLDTKRTVFGERDKAGTIREDRVAREEKAKAEKKREQEQKRAESQSDRSAATAGKFGRDAERLIPKGVSDKFRAAVEKAADGLQNGDQGGEMARLISLMEQLAAVAEKRGDNSLARRIDILEQQIRKNRPPGK